MIDDKDFIPRLKELLQRHGVLPRQVNPEYPYWTPPFLTELLDSNDIDGAIIHDYSNNNPEVIRAHSATNRVVFMMRNPISLDFEIDNAVKINALMRAAKVPTFNRSENFVGAYHQALTFLNERLKITE